LHGIPWGAKDLLDTAGISTTYGAEPFRNRVPRADATVVQRLHQAGAVLVAKLSLGALALNDIWFGGQTMNPWLLEEGASGSSAGPGAATAAGLVGFARADLRAGFTAERDMGTEGAGSADTAVRDAIDEGLIPGPRLRISSNAVDILGGHEDAIHYNPAQHILSNATYANNTAELVTVIRQQIKEGADFIKIYETGPDTLRDGRLSTPYQYTEAELSIAVQEAARAGKRVAVHATGEPGTLYAAQAGVASIDHAYQLSAETMQLMHEKRIFAVPTFTISEYFADHAGTAEQAAIEQRMLDLHAEEFRKQLAAGVPMAAGSDVGPFPHGTQAREFVLMVKYGMSPLQVLQADLLNGAKLLGWEGEIGALKPGHLADIIAVPGDPLQDIDVLQEVSFVMKGGVVYRN